MDRHVIIIGAGFGGLATACLLGKAGYRVTIYEKNDQAGGRLGLIEAEGFRFDSGPSWFLMKDVFEHFFGLLDQDLDNLVELQRLSPSYQVLFKDTLMGAVKMYGETDRDTATLESYEPRSREQLKDYIEQSSYKYEVAKREFLYKNYNSRADFFTPKLIREGVKLNVLSNVQKFVTKQFSSREIQTILQYPLAFLGTDPKKAPAIYSLMSHLDFTQGVYYPKGGMYELTQILVRLAESYGVNIQLNQPVDKILCKNGRAQGVMVNGEKIKGDVVISNADIHHTEQALLDKKDRAYSGRYWAKRTVAPSALLLYLGVSGRYPDLEHHNLVFSKNWDKKFSALFGKKKLPKDPSFYVCNPSKTNPSVAPNDHENLFVLVPVPAGVRYSDEQLEKFSNEVLEAMESSLHLKGLRQRIVYKKAFCRKDFEQQYNSYRGSALGLSHTLKQTAVFRPSNQHKKLPNLLFVGANTTPGIGLPMCLISAELAYKRIINNTSSSPLKKLAS